MPPKENKKEERKTFKELADYLSFITPHREEIYQSIAEFFGEDVEIPKRFKK